MWVSDSGEECGPLSLDRVLILEVWDCRAMGLGFTSRLFRARHAAFCSWRLVFVSASQ